MFRSNINNKREIIADSITTTDLKVKNFELDGSIEGFITTSATEQTKLGRLNSAGSTLSGTSTSLNVIATANSASINFLGPNQVITFNDQWKIEYETNEPDKLSIKNSSNNHVITLGNSGNLSIGSKTLLPCGYDINSNLGNFALKLPEFTTGQRDNNITDPLPGLIIFNSTDNRVEFYNEQNNWVVLNDNGNNVVTNLKDDSIAADANINITKLGTGLINNTTFSYLQDATSNIQAQIDQTVKLSGNQTISGNKTFNNIALMPGIRNSSEGAADFIFQNDSGVTIASFNNGTGIFSSGFGFNVNTSGAATFAINGVALKNFTETLTNKTISGNNNTLTNIPSSALPSEIPYTNLASNTFQGDIIVDNPIRSKVILKKNIEEEYEVVVDNGFKIIDSEPDINNTLFELKSESCVVNSAYLDISNLGGLRVNNVKVVGARMAAVPNLLGSASTSDIINKINDILNVLRVHGLISS